METPHATSTSSPETADGWASWLTGRARCWLGWLRREWNPFHWRIERRVLAGFALVFATLLVIAGFAFRNTNQYFENSQRDAQSREALQFLALTLTLLEDSDLGLRRYLVTGDRTYLTSYENAKRRVPVQLDHLHELMREQEEQRTRLQHLTEAAARLMDAGTEAIALRKAQGFQGVGRLVREGVAARELNEIRRLVDVMGQSEREALRRRGQQSIDGTRVTIALLSIGTVLQFLLLSLVYYLIRHDIDQRRRVAAELERRGVQLEAANKELEAFSYSVSHDLRAPLRHIDGYVSLLEKRAARKLDEKARHYLQTISDSATQMGRLIDDLLLFSRMGRAEMANTPVHLDQLVKDVLHDLRHETQHRAISWNVRPLPVVQADPSMLRQVFMNLISNAVKFTSTRPLATIEVGSEPGQDGDVVIYVRDNGVGFDMQYADKLFGVFQRLHRAEEFEGTGIGLANVRRIISRQSGKTWAEGVPDGGATFYFTLPLASSSA